MCEVTSVEQYTSYLAMCRALGADALVPWSAQGKVPPRLRTVKEAFLEYEWLLTKRLTGGGPRHRKTPSMTPDQFRNAKPWAVGLKLL